MVFEMSLTGSKYASDASLGPICGASGSACDTSAAQRTTSSEPRPTNGIAGVSRLAHSFANARLGLSQLIHRNAAPCEGREPGTSAAQHVLSPPGPACLCAHCSEQGGAVVSCEPEVSIFHNFLTAAECEHLIKTAEQIGMQRSAVLGNVVTPDRTSSETTLLHRETETVAAIEQRIAHVAGASLANCGPLSVLHYAVGQRFRLHYDWSPSLLRQRTAILYLSTPELGGETVFPNAAGAPAAGLGWQRHKRGGLTVDARAGSLLLFRNVGADGLLDRASLHESKAVTQGSKWAATKWIYEEATTRK